MPYELHWHAQRSATWSISNLRMNKWSSISIEGRKQTSHRMIIAIVMSIKDFYPGDLAHI